MNRSFKLLEALNDIDESLLIKDLESKVKKHINKKWIYILAPAITFSIVLIFAIYTNNTIKDANLLLAKNNQIQNKEINDDRKLVNNDSIVFNNHLIQLSDIDGKSEKMDVISNFRFLNELKIPEKYSLLNQYALYEKEDLNESEYTKLWQYTINYQIQGSNVNDVPSDIEITFTKEDHILGCMLPKKESFEISKIYNNNIYLFNSDKGTTMQAYFEYEGYKFFIESFKLNENEFVELIKSIIQ